MAQQAYADAPLSQDDAKAVGYQDVPLSWPARYPKTAAVAKGALDALPAAGAMVGGVVGAGPAAASGPGAPFVEAAAVGLGAGAGRGLRDLIAEGLGLEDVTSPGSKATRIALDTAEAGAAQAILPGLIEAMKTPGKTVREIVEMLPKRIRPTLPKGLGESPAKILTRPAWQTWQEYLTPAADVSDVQLARQEFEAGRITDKMLAGIEKAAQSPLKSGTTATVGTNVVSGNFGDKLLELHKAKLKLTAIEMKQAQEMLRRGIEPQAILDNIEAARAFAGKFNTPTPTKAQTKFPKGMRGKTTP